MVAPQMVGVLAIFNQRYTYAVLSNVTCEVNLSCFWLKTHLILLLILHIRLLGVTLVSNFSSFSCLCVRYVISGFFSALWHFSCYFFWGSRRFSLPLWQLPQFYFEL